MLESQLVPLLAEKTAWRTAGRMVVYLVVWRAEKMAAWKARSMVDSKVVHLVP